MPHQAISEWRRRDHRPTLNSVKWHCLRTPTSHEMRMMCRKRGQQRWSALVSANTSRIARLMRAYLGEARWSAFVAHAEQHYKKQFLRAFEPSSGVIVCQGPIEGGPCPRAFKVRVDDPSAQELMQSMHLDHTHDVSNICSVWRASIPPNSRDWSVGVDPVRLCRLLFSLSTTPDGLEPCLHFRCGSSRADRSMSTRTCHSARAHYAHALSDLR